MGVSATIGGVTRTGQDFGFGETPAPGQDWMSQLWGQSRQLNAGGGGGGGGGGQPMMLVGGQLVPASYATGKYESDVAAKTAQQELAAKNARFNQIFGSLQGFLGGRSNPYTIGGSSGAGPEISVGGVLSPEQVQQQVNAARAGNDAATAGRMREFAGGAAGRGFAASSPLIAAMQGQLWGQNMATNADTERQTRLAAAQANAGQLLQTQQAREGQYASRQQEQIERAKPYFQTQNALIAALAGLA